MVWVIEAVKVWGDLANWALASWAFNWIMINFFGNSYVKYLVKRKVLEWVAEAEAEKQLKQFVEDPNPMLSFMQAESELEYKNMFWTIAKVLPKIKNWVPNKSKVNLDIIKRLKDLSKDFSSNDMQEIVAGILAWEYNQPWTFSIKTLEVVKSLSKKDIELFQKFCWYVFDWKNFFVDWYNLGSEDLSILGDMGIWYNEYLYLQDLWLIGSGRKFSQEFGNKMDSETEYAYQFSIQNRLIVLHRKWAITINGLWSLTRAWEELLTITGFVPNEVLKNLVIDHFNKLWFH